MKILLDNCVPRPFERLLPGHEVSHASRHGWGSLSNGKLLDAAEDAGFEALVTTDKSIEHQQHLTGRPIAIILLRAKSNDIYTLQPLASLAMVALLNLKAGAVIAVGPGEEWP